MRQARTALAAVLLCAAGCQSDIALRRVDPDRSARESDKDLIIMSDTRRVTLDFTTPPVNDSIDDDMIFAYLSLPLHPLNGVEFNRFSVGAGWQNTAMSFSGLVDPSDIIPAIQAWRHFDPNASLLDVPGANPPYVMREPSPDMNEVDPRYPEYSAALMDAALRHGETGGDVMAEAPKAPVPTAAAEDD
jgi:hypothetical protein